ncbi:MAG: hypothetical protein ACPGWR_00965 [Ardenticatenaceae bacterium]
MNVFDKIASRDVNGIRSFSPGTIPDSIHTSNLPARLILPFYTAGGVNRVKFPPRHYHEATRQVFDLYLVRPVGQGTGLSDVLPDLIDYQEQYIAFCRDFNLTHEREEIKIISLTSVSNGYEWPLGSGVFFFGVLNTLEVKTFGG